MSSAQDVSDRLLFVEVPPPGSGGVVAELSEMNNVVAAAALYSGVDVVAHLRGTTQELSDAIARINQAGAPIEQVIPFDVAETYEGPRFADLTFRSPNACRAYIRCTVDTSKASPDYAARALRRMDATVAVYRSATESDLIVEVLAANKRDFDRAVMSEVQAEWKIITSTRTYLVINTLTWRMGWDKLTPTIFISYSHLDDDFTRRLRDHIEEDLGLHCWRAADDLTIGGPSWPANVDQAITIAPLHLYVLTKAHLDSKECQREFGESIRTVAQQEDICCFVKPSGMIKKLPDRYRVRNCLPADDLYSYPQLLQWVQERLAAVGSAT